MDQDKQHSVVDEITYLAALVSRPQAIAPILETFHEVTARLTPSQTLQSADRVTLEKLRIRLAEYLVHDETLRSFTHATLQEKVFEHFEGKHRIRKLKWLTVLIVGVSLFIVFGPSFLFPNILPGNLEQQTLLMPIILYGAPAMLFSLALRDFAPKLRQAYTSVCVGIFLLGAAAIHEVLLDVYFANSVWTRAGGEMLGYALAFFAIHFGIQKHGQLLGVIMKFTNSLVLLLSGMAIWALAVLASQAVGISAVTSAQSGATALAALVVGFGAFEAYKIWKHSNQLYARATKWLFFFLALQLYAVLQYLVVQFIVQDLEHDIVLVVLGLPYIIAAALLFVSGYTFNKVGRY